MMAHRALPHSCNCRRNCHVRPCHKLPSQACTKSHLCDSQRCFFRLSPRTAAVTGWHENSSVAVSCHFHVDWLLSQVCTKNHLCDSVTVTLTAVTLIFCRRRAPKFTPVTIMITVTAVTLTTVAGEHEHSPLILLLLLSLVTMALTAVTG